MRYYFRVSKVGGEKKKGEKLMDGEGGRNAE